MKICALILVSSICTCILLYKYIEQYLFRKRKCVHLTGSDCISIVLPIFISLVHGALVPNTQNNDKLQHVQIVWRHGDRSPIGTPPNDRNDWTKWPQGFGQLSTRGMQQHLKLGQLIQQTYGNDQLLSKVYKYHEVYAFSDDVPRCIQSASANFAGLYESCGQAGCPDSVKKWPKHWSPVPIHTSEHDTDYILSHPYCPAADAAHAEFESTNPTYRNITAMYAPIMKAVSQIAGYNPPLPFDNIGYLWDPLYIEMNWGNLDGSDIKAPDWWNQTIYATVANNSNLNLYEWASIMNNYVLYYDYYPDDEAKFIGGPLLNQLISVMNSKIQYSYVNPDGLALSSDEKQWGLQKYYAYSTHGSTLLGLLRVLGNNLNGVVVPTYPDLEPKYAAAVSFELYGPDHSTDSSYYSIMVKYHDGIWYNHTKSGNCFTGWTDITSTVVQCMNRLDSSGRCPLTTFINNSAAYKNFTNNNMPYLCKQTLEELRRQNVI